MMKLLFLICAVCAGFLLVLTISFDVWVYLTTKNFDFMLRTWMERHKSPDPRLLPKQAALLRLICLTERGLKYFFYFVINPIVVLLVFKFIGLGAKNG
jgi:hypothetical protein